GPTSAHTATVASATKNAAGDPTASALEAAIRRNASRSHDGCGAALSVGEADGRWGVGDPAALAAGFWKSSSVGMAILHPTRLAPRHRSAQRSTPAVLI